MGLSAANATTAGRTNCHRRKEVAATSVSNPGQLADDLVEAGIIDPAKVVRAALENAVSVAGTLLLTEGTLTEIEEQTTEAGPRMPEFG